MSRIKTRHSNRERKGTVVGAKVPPSLLSLIDDEAERNKSLPHHPTTPPRELPQGTRQGRCLMNADQPKAEYHLAQMQRHEEDLRKIQRQAAVGEEDEVPPSAKRYLYWVFWLSLGFIVFVAVMYKILD